MCHLNASNVTNLLYKSKSKRITLGNQSQYASNFSHKPEILLKDPKNSISICDLHNLCLFNIVNPAPFGLKGTVASKIPSKISNFMIKSGNQEIRKEICHFREIQNRKGNPSGNQETGFP